MHITLLQFHPLVMLKGGWHNLKTILASTGGCDLKGTQLLSAGKMMNVCGNPDAACPQLCFRDMAACFC